MLKRIAFCLVVLSASSVEAGEIAVVVNAAHPDGALSIDAVKKAYLEDQMWGNGEKIKRFYQADNAAMRSAMCEKLFGKTCGELDRHFGEVGYQKGLTPEKASNGAGDVANMVKTFKGGLGIMDKAAATDPGIKVVHSVSF